MNTLFKKMMRYWMEVLFALFIAVYIYAFLLEAFEQSGTTKATMQLTPYTTSPLTSTTDVQNDKTVSYPLTGTKPKSDSMYPLRGAALVNLTKKSQIIQGASNGRIK